MLYQAGYSEGMLADDSRMDWTNTHSRPIKWSCWYPAPIDTSTSEHRFGGSADHALFTGGLVSMGAVVSNTRKQWPLVLLSHGTGGTANGMAWLATKLAQTGYICIGVDHHGNTGSEIYRPEGFICWWERGIDLTFIIDHVDQISPIENRVNLMDISVVGFSLGGYTALSLAGAITSMEQFENWLTTDINSSGGPREFPDLDREITKLISSSSRFRESWEQHGDSYLDARVSTCVAIAPAPTVRGFVTDSLRRIDIPTLILGGEADLEAPFQSCAQWLFNQNPGFKLKSLGKEVGHYVFLAECTDHGKCVEPEICSDASNIVRSEIHTDTALLISKFLTVPRPGDR